MDKKPLKTEVVYEDLKQAMHLAWDDDDLMDQDNLFELQDLLADLTLKVARWCGKEMNLAAEFPYLYKVKEN